MMVSAECGADAPKSGGNAEFFRPERSVAALAFGAIFTFRKGFYNYEFKTIEIIEQKCEIP